MHCEIQAYTLMNDIFENLEKIILVTINNIFHIYNIETNETELI